MGYCFINVILCLCDLYSHPSSQNFNWLWKIKKDVYPVHYYVIN